MRICVFGAGAIGGFIAGYMARGGVDVSVVARGPHLQAIRDNGLTVEAPDERFTVNVPASDNPADFGPQDGVLVCLKAPGLRAAAGMAPLLRPDTPVAFLTNGVPWWYFHGHGGALDGHRLPLLDPDDLLWNTIGPARTVGGIAWPASAVPEPGVIRVRGPKMRGTVLGPIDGAVTSGILALEQAFRAADLPVSVDTGIRDRIWEKIAFNLSAGPMCVLTGTPVSDTQAEAALVAASRQVLAETQALITALGRHAIPDVEQILTVNRSLGHRPSILQDLLAGRPMEVDALYTVPLQLAALTGTRMPTLELLAALIRTKLKSLPA